MGHRRTLFTDSTSDNVIVNAAGDLLDALTKPAFIYRMAAAQYYDITQNDYHCSQPGNPARLKSAKTRMVNAAKEIQEIVRQYRDW